MLKYLNTPIAATALTAIATVALADDIPVIDSIRESGNFTIANSLAYAPFEFVGEDGEPAGVDIELATAAAELMGAELKIDVVPFASQIPGLAADRFKVAWSTFTVTAERLEQVDFVSFLQTGVVIVTTPEAVASFEGEHSVCGRTIAVLTGSSGDFVADTLTEACEAAGQPAVDKQIYPEQKDAIQAIMAGRVEARLEDSTSAGYYQVTSEGAQVVVGEPMFPLPLGVAVRKGDTATAEMMQAVFNAMIADGSYAEILSNYQLDASALTESTIYTDAAQLPN